MEKVKAAPGVKEMIFTKQMSANANLQKKVLANICFRQLHMTGTLDWLQPLGSYSLLRVLGIVTVNYISQGSLEEAMCF